MTTSLKLEIVQGKARITVEGGTLLDQITRAKLIKTSLVEMIAASAHADNCRVTRPNNGLGMGPNQSPPHIVLVTPYVLVQDIVAQVMQQS